MRDQSISFFARISLAATIGTSALMASTAGCGSTTKPDASAAAGNGGTSSGGMSGSAGASSGGSSSGDAGSGGSNTGGASSGAGGDGQGGASSGGASSGGAGQAGAAGSGTAGMVGTIGQSCSPPGALACAGNYQKLTVVCGGDGTWEVNQTCGTDQFCDSTPGPNVGTCQPQAPECRGGPGGRCEGRSTLIQCGPDAVSSTAQECNCWAGECLADGEEPCPDPEDFAFTASCDAECGLSGCMIEDVCPSRGVGEFTAFPAAVRTAAYGDVCACPEGQRHYMLTAPRTPGTPVRVSVKPPWGLQFSGTQCSGDIFQCFVFDHVAEYPRGAYLVTEDPSAGPANVLYEAVEPGTTTATGCP